MKSPPVNRNFSVVMHPSHASFWESLKIQWYSCDVQQTGSIELYSLYATSLSNFFLQVIKMHVIGYLLVFGVPTVLGMMNLMWFGKIVKGLMKTISKRRWEMSSSRYLFLFSLLVYIYTMGWGEQGIWWYVVCCKWFKIT